jgi:molybdopterin converting factor small subunit
MTDDGARPPAGGVSDGVARHAIRVILPPHLRTLAGTRAEVVVEVADPATMAAVLDALEARYPPLRGTIRDPRTGARRAFVRFFVGGRDVSLEPPETPLPESDVAGRDAFRVLGAIAGG